MDKKIIIRYGEIHLKGKNRGFFEKTLINNIKENLAGIDCKIEIARGRYSVSSYRPDCESIIVDRLKSTFGIHSVSVVHETDTDFERIATLAVALSGDSGTFCVRTNRADKQLKMTSMQISAFVGSRILDKKPNLSVDLFAPDFVINIDIRENGKAYVFPDKIICVDGMPVGTAGKGLALLSGGIDSPVACYMMAKRGLRLEMLHFHSYPYTSEAAKQKVIELCKKLRPYVGKIKLLTVSVTKIQEEIHKCARPSYMITLLRLFMMRIAEKIAIKRGNKCLVNGESLGQVASQTIESLTITNSQVVSIPVFRPLIGLNKSEIIEIAKKIGTFETSILPHEDCCTVFLPESPITHPKMSGVLCEVSKLSSPDELISEAIDSMKIIEID